MQDLYSQTFRPQARLNGQHHPSTRVDNISHTETQSRDLGVMTSRISCLDLHAYDAIASLYDVFTLKCARKAVAGAVTITVSTLLSSSRLLLFFNC